MRPKEGILEAVEGLESEVVELDVPPLMELEV